MYTCTQIDVVLPHLLKYNNTRNTIPSDGARQWQQQHSRAVRTCDNEEEEEEEQIENLEAASFVIVVIIIVITIAA